MARVMRVMLLGISKASLRLELSELSQVPSSHRIIRFDGRLEGARAAERARLRPVLAWDRPPFAWLGSAIESRERDIDAWWRSRVSVYCLIWLLELLLARDP